MKTIRTLFLFLLLGFSAAFLISTSFVYAAAKYDVGNYSPGVYGGDVDAPDINLTVEDTSLGSGEPTTVTCDGTDSSGMESVVITDTGVEICSGVSSCTAIFQRTPAGDYVVKCTVTDISGLANSTNETIKVKGSSGGSGGASSSTANFQSIFVVRAVPGVITTIDFNAKLTQLNELSVQVSEPVYAFTVKVTKLNVLPSSVSAAASKVYGYLEVEAPKLSSIIKSAAFEFVVENSWLDRNNLTAEEMFMYRHVGGRWEKLETTVVSASSEFVVFRAKTQGFSTFAIASGNDAEGRLSETNQTKAENMPVVSSDNEIPMTKAAQISEKTLPWLITALILIIIFVAYFFAKSK